MPLTVGDLLRVSGLALKPAAGTRGLSNTIRSVHVSELEDPTPWLKGGELLLTTGMGVGTTAAAQRSYVKRLTNAGLAGLGFGLGFSFQKLPKAIRDAAERESFPILEVPYPVPFIAITEAVFTRLSRDQYELLSRSLEAEHALTRAVLEGRGVSGVVTSLARAVGGWALLLDLRGLALAAAPRAARENVQLVWSALRSQRPSGNAFSIALVEGSEHISVQPVSSQGHVEAFLAVGKPDALSQFDRIVSSHALALLALELDKARAISETERRLKGDLLDQLLTAGARTRPSRQALERFGFDLASHVAVVVMSGGNDLDRLGRACEAALAERYDAFMVSVRGDSVAAVFQPAAKTSLSDLRQDVAERVGDDVVAGLGSTVTIERLLQGMREARYALQVCRTEGKRQAEFRDLGTYQLLLSLQDPEALRTFADSVLAALDEYDRDHGGELVASLRAFLERNARWEEASAQLYVHRHTLRYRMRKVQELTGRDLSSARDRMEFFLALRARDLLASADTTGLSQEYNGDAGLSPSAAATTTRKE